MIYKEHEVIPNHTPLLTLAKNQQCILMPVGDLHNDADGCIEKRFVEHLQWGMERGALFLGMGDMADFASGTQRAIMNQLRDSTRQFLDERVRERILRLSGLISFTKGHWLGLLQGNHRWVFADGTSADQLLCEQLGCDFLGDTTLIRLVFPEYQLYPESDCLIFAHHGIGAPKLVGSHLHKLEDLLRWIEADVYLMGHSHCKVAAPIDRIHFSRNGIQYHRTKVIARTGGFLAGYKSNAPLSLDEPVYLSEGSYVEKKLLPPSGLGGPLIAIGIESVDGTGIFKPSLHVSL